MDLLENYKKAWDNQPEEISKFSAIEIYKMAHAKSSSIVKWIFVISIIEFVVFNSLYFLFDMEETNKTYKKYNIEDFVFYSQIAAYVVLFYFLKKFYKNYKNISVTDTTKSLMKKILKTRKTVRNYVFFNLGYLVLVSIVLTSAMIKQEFASNSNNVGALIITMIITTIILVGLFLLVYSLIYGILLKKLNKNYKELAKLDELK